MSEPIKDPRPRLAALETLQPLVKMLMNMLWQSGGCDALSEWQVSGERRMDAMIDQLRAEVRDLDAKERGTGE